MTPKYQTLEDFTREHIRPGLRAGWTIDDIGDPTEEDHDFDVDPFEAALRAREYEADDSDEDE